MSTNFIAAFSAPVCTPTAIILAMIATGMAQPIIFQMGALFGITLMDSSLGSSRFSSIMCAIPFMWPAPTTATIFLPGAFLILLARNWTNDAFDSLFANTDTVENEKYRLLYNAVNGMADEYTYCEVPVFEGASDTQSSFEKNVKSVLSAAHEEYLRRVADGENADTVMDELAMVSSPLVCNSPSA